MEDVAISGFGKQFRAGQVAVVRGKIATGTDSPVDHIALIPTPLLWKGRAVRCSVRMRCAHLENKFPRLPFLTGSYRNYFSALLDQKSREARQGYEMQLHINCNPGCCLTSVIGLAAMTTSPEACELILLCLTILAGVPQKHSIPGQRVGLDDGFSSNPCCLH